jgi:hypothetical protein
VSYYYRKKVLQAFNVQNGTYRHVLTDPVIGGIDNLGMLSILAGAAKIAGDTQVQQFAEEWCNTCTSISKNCRNFDVVPHDGWFNTGEYYWKEKPQCYAGPFGYEWARNQGCNLPKIWDVPLAKWIAMVPSIFIRYLGFKQHLNTCMVAKLLEGNRPGSSWDWAKEDNAFYSYIAGEKCRIPQMNIYSSKTTKDVKEIVPIQQRQGSQWIWKQWPFTRCIEFTDREYTPTALLIGEYLQGSLDE